MEENKMILKVTIKLTSDETFSVGIYEPQSGDYTEIDCHDKGWETMKENTIIMQEIRSWVTMLREEQAYEREGT